MRYFLSCLLIILTISVSYCSDNDSLQSVIDTRNGIEKADALIKLALKIKKTAKDDALKKVIDAHKIASKKNDIKYIIKSINAKGSIYLSNNDLNTADSLFKYSIELSEEKDFAEGLASSYAKMSKLYSRAAQYTQALEYANTSVKYSNKLNEIIILSGTYLTIGNIHYYMGSRDSAIHYFEKSLALKQELKDESGASGVSMNIGVISYQAGKYDKSLAFYNKALESFNKLKDSLSIGMALENISITLYHQGNLDSALRINEEALTLYKKVNDKGKIASCLENIALNYDALGNITEALSLQLEAVKIKEEIGDKRGLGFSYINLSSYYKKLNQYDKAISLTNKSLALFIEIEDKYNVARSHSNLSGIYYSKKNYDKGIEESLISLEMNQELNNKNGIAGNYLTLGNLYNKKEDKKIALEYYLKSLEINEQIGDLSGVAGLLSNIGVIYYDFGEFKKAKKYYEKSLELRKEIGVKIGIIESYKTLANVSNKLKSYKDAFDYLYLYADGKEELLNENITEQLAEMDAKYESEKKEQEITLLQKEGEFEKNKHKEETRRNNLIIYSAIGFLILIAFIAIVLFRQNAQKKKTNNLLSQQNDEITKQKEEVEHQKHIVDEKNREITDSITYAKRIQEAILPPTKLVKEWLPESFVLYKPKDIVAGDFYWMENIDETIIFAVADCTGHGVPGAMVSVVCHNAMNRAVREFKLREPAKILDKTRALVIETFDNGDEDVKDGMDIALCSFNTITKQLNYSGANNALYLIRDGELKDYKADKQPIGQYIDEKPFTNHIIDLQKGDSIYIFSDGYVDQFGGEKGKKLKSKPFKDLILSFQGKSMEKQREILDKSFEDWKGDLEQIDDVCVIGVSV